MHRTFARCFLTLSAVLLISCGPSVIPELRSNGEAAIRAADEAWSAAAGKHDLEGILAYYTDDAVILPPNAAIAADKKARRENWAPLVAPNSAVSWKATKVEVAQSGELGYLYGTYRLSMKAPDGAAIEDKGKIVEVWKKQADGSWKCIVDTFNSDIPVPPPAEPKK